MSKLRETLKQEAAACACRDQEFAALYHALAVKLLNAGELDRAGKWRKLRAVRREQPDTAREWRLRLRGEGA